eukprot:Seg671.6 transcript_id=Seg671.6/GoldUCD/mRNA.D3Y31 product="hypothetical protein" protein_id=Seg671.6/GoldUCD/D3Y31
MKRWTVSRFMFWREKTWNNIFGGKTFGHVPPSSENLLSNGIYCIAVLGDACTRSCQEDEEVLELDHEIVILNDEIEKMMECGTKKQGVEIRGTMSTCHQRME